MTGRIPDAFIDELLARVDVVDVVNQRVRLKKTGKNYSACCPFHNENTPSFTVSPDKQFYHCFGCGANGSAIKFVMEFDGLSFPDAIDKLAGELNMTVPRSNDSRQLEQERRQKPLYKHMQEASDLYIQLLRTHEDKHRAVEYLKNRGLSGRAAKFFGIGFAPHGWDTLEKHANTSSPDQTTSQGSTPDAVLSHTQWTRHMVACGMLIEKEDGRTYDRFRERIMFPIRDARGRVIAFGGRVLGDEKPKYLNSPETPIFQKSRELYGLYEARKVRQKLTRIVIVEGYMDVVALAEFGIHYAVATLGTATSEHHLRRLFKVVPEVIFCFDGDNAGRTAAARAMETVLPLLDDGLQARFLFLPEGDDPDSIVQREGKAAFEQRLDQSTHLPEFVFEQLKQQVDMDSLNGKARLDQLAAPLINKLPRGLLRQLMRQELEKLTGHSSIALSKLEQQPSTSDDHTPPSKEPQHTSYGVTPNDTAAITSNPEPDLPVLEASQGDDSATLERLEPQVLKALAALVYSPSLAQALPPCEFDAQTDNEILLQQVLKKLHESPQQSSIGILTQWVGSPFQAQLKAIAETKDQCDVLPQRGDVMSVLTQLNFRSQEHEHQQLRAAFARGDTLSAQQKARLQELNRQHHQQYRKRGRRR